MILAVIILSTLVLIFGYTTYNLFKKQEKSETIVIEVSDKKIQELDQMGAFANDDETGVIFDGIKQIQEILNEFNVKQQ